MSNVDVLTKIDLHIHSAASIESDPDKVAENTQGNLGVLIAGLINNKVNMVSVTDHNAFDSKLYLEFKKQEELDNCIKKVLPGIEVTTEINGEDVHIVCIFDDRFPERIEEIEKQFTETRCYKESELKTALSKIGLNVVLIAHQKEDPDKTNPDKSRHSFSLVGKEEFNKSIRIGYIDALEFPASNYGVQGMINGYLSTNNLERISTITGSDCHNWSVYPKYESDKDEMPGFAFIKALPTFKGLVMAITEPLRIGVNEEIARKVNSEKGIELLVDGAEKTIPLSQGINVIIGDNSMGKSLLLNRLAQNTLEGSVGIKREAGYNKFLKQNKLEIISGFARDKVDHYYQGYIREKFENNGKSLFDDPKLGVHFESISTEDAYRDIATSARNITKVWEHKKALNSKFEYVKEMTTPIPYKCVKSHSYHPSVDGDLTSLYPDKITNEYLSKYTGVIDGLQDIIDSDLTGKEDKGYLSEIIAQLEVLKSIYAESQRVNKIKLKVINAIESFAKEYEASLDKEIGDEEREQRLFLEQYPLDVNEIVEFIKLHNKNIEYDTESFREILIKNEESPLGEYKCVTRINGNIITIEKFKEAVCSQFNTKPEVTFEDIVGFSLIDAEKHLNKNFLKNSPGITVSEKFINLVKKFFNDELDPSNSILKNTQENNEVNSQGMNSLIYLDVVSQIGSVKSIIMLDQPEDYVAQSKIGQQLFEIIRKMAKRSQIIFVTHNPQLVVNLDVDNVIILKHKDNKIEVVSGPLEQEIEVDILKEVADILDGGETAIRKRWRRYGKE